MDPRDHLDPLVVMVVAAPKVLVVGASSGIGLAISKRAVRRGALVAMAARRVDLLEQGAADANRSVSSGEFTGSGGQAKAFACDVTDEVACRNTVNSAVEWLGGLDKIVYASASTNLSTLEKMDAAAWRDLLDTNVVGAGVVVSASLAHLRRGDHPTAVFLSSHSVADPWPGLVAYAASKAALETTARGLRNEERSIRVLTVSVGPTLTGFADGWDQAATAEAFSGWQERGLLRNEFLTADQVAEAIVEATLNGNETELAVIGEESQ